MTTEQPPQPATLWAQAFRTWAESWQAAAGQAASAFPLPVPLPFTPPAADGADAAKLANRAFDEWLSGWGAFFEETLHSPEVIAAGGRTLDAQLNIEKPLREQTAARMQFWLEFMNMPSRRDLIRALAQLNDANSRLDVLHEQVEQLSDQVAELTALLRAQAKQKGTGR